MRLLLENQTLKTHSRIELDKDDSHYLLHVLRLKPGDCIALFNGLDPLGEYRGSIASINKKSAIIDILEFVPVDNESPLEITLYQGVAKSARMDYSLQKAVELGVRRIVPLLSSRCQMQSRDQKRIANKMQHWRGIIRHALQQSGRTARVELQKPCSLDIISKDSCTIQLIPSPRAKVKLSQFCRRQQAVKRVAIVIGPEGGFSEEELRFCQQWGFSAVALGPRILRTETAGLAIISHLQAIWGDY